MGKADEYRVSEPDYVSIDEFGESENRRIRGQRVEVRMPVYATLNGRPIQGFLEAQNLSWSGMFIATNFPLKPGDILELEFTLPENDHPIHARAKVIHVIGESRPEEATGVGVLFQELDVNVQRMLTGWVLEHLPEA